jgi:hypothetical protein
MIGPNCDPKKDSTCIPKNIISGYQPTSDEDMDWQENDGSAFVIAFCTSRESLHICKLGHRNGCQLAFSKKSNI